MSGVPGLIRALLPPVAPGGVAGQIPLDAEQLRAILDIGDVLTVKVLAQVVGRPTIEIAGRPAMAALPNGVAPGDLLHVRVEGFTSDQVLLKLLTLTRIPASAAPTARAPDAPRAVSAPPEIPTAITAPPARTSAEILPVLPEAPPTSEAPAAPSFVIPRQAAAEDADAVATVARQVPNASDDRQTSADVTPLRARLAAFRLSTASGASVPPRRTTPPLPSAPPPAETPSSSPRPSLPLQTVLPQTPGAAVLRALRIPVTPTTLAAARIASEGSARVAAALNALQRALPLGSADPRVQQLRTIAEFVGTLDPREPQALPARLEAYVEHVLGQETRLTQALAPTPAHVEPATAAPLPHVAPPEVDAARMAVAREAVASNLKTQVMALLAGAPGDATTRSVLQQALTAITASQLQTLSLQNATPQMLAIPLPLPFPQGGQQAYVRIARDGRRSNEPLSAESFHLALVLETQHHGTVAVELFCAERAVSVDVKAERESAAAAFKRALPNLSSRLERLSYRVVRTEASVAPALGGAEAAPAIDSRSVAPSDGDGARGLDLQA